MSEAFFKTHSLELQPQRCFITWSGLVPGNLHFAKLNGFGIQQPCFSKHHHTFCIYSIPLGKENGRRVSGNAKWPFESNCRCFAWSRSPVRRSVFVRASCSLKSLPFFLDHLQKGLGSNLKFGYSKYLPSSSHSLGNLIQPFSHHMCICMYFCACLFIISSIAFLLLSFSIFHPSLYKTFKILESNGQKYMLSGSNFCFRPHNRNLSQCYRHMSGSDTGGKIIKPKMHMGMIYISGISLHCSNKIIQVFKSACLLMYFLAYKMTP